MLSFTKPLVRICIAAIVLILAILTIAFAAPASAADNKPRPVFVKGKIIPIPPGHLITLPMPRHPGCTPFVFTPVSVDGLRAANAGSRVCPL